MILPSSNTTMEIEIPAMLRSVDDVRGFSFHSSRMRMQHVTAEELARMDAESERCAIELSDARCDAIAYACLVAIMAKEPGYHETAERRLCSKIEFGNDAPPIISSAGALIAALRVLGAKRIGIVTPYLKALTARVAAYIEEEGIEVVDSVSLEIADNVAVGRLDPRNLLDAWRRLDLASCDALVLSACVQMPSLPILDQVEKACGLPVLSAATATTFALLRALRLRPLVQRAGHLLSGAFAEA